MRAIVALAFAVMASPSLAYTELNVAKMQRGLSPNFIDLLINGTSQGRRLMCGVYNAQGKLVATGEGYTSNMATKITVYYTGRDEATARCALNN